MARTGLSGTLAVRRSLRTLYLVRAAFSLVWLLLLAVSTSDVTMTDRATFAVGILLVVYPAWDVAATFADLKTTGGQGVVILQRVNLVVSSVATVAMFVAVLSSVGHAVVVFGIWAVVAGAITLVVAIRRIRTVGLQWAMFISGGLALFIGSSFLAQARDASSSPSILVSYAGGGVLWFVLAAVTLIRKPRRAAEV